MSDYQLFRLTLNELMERKRKKYGKLYGQCIDCKKYINFISCMTFDNIPMKILTGEHDHTEPYPGDNGIQFEPTEDAE